MGIGSGLGGQLGIKAEGTYGTPEVVDRFYESNSEGIEVDVGKIYSRGIGTGRFQRNDRVKSYIKGAAGSIEMDVLNKSFGLWFQHMLGQDTITGAGADKTHTCIHDPLALQGKSLTLQVGRPDIAGVVQPFTFEGGKVVDWELKAAIDEKLSLAVNMDFENVLTGMALAAAAYVASQEMFVFTEGALTVAGAAVPVRSFSIKGNNALATDRRFLGNTKKEPLAAGEMAIEGTLDAEFESLARYAAWVAGTQAQLILTFTLATLIPTTAVPFSLTVTIPKIEYTGETPKVGGPEIVRQGAPFKALYNGTDPILSLVYVTSDAAA